MKGSGVRVPASAPQESPANAGLSCVSGLSILCLWPGGGQPIGQHENGLVEFIRREAVGAREGDVGVHVSARSVGPGGVRMLTAAGGCPQARRAGTDSPS